MRIVGLIICQSPQFFLEYRNSKSLMEKINMKRKLVFDTETTGLYVEENDRIVELGLVEIIDNKKTGSTFQSYLNPGKPSKPEALAVHGLTDKFLADKPAFRSIADEFIDYVKGAVLVIHNETFDLKMINHELKMANKGSIWDYISGVECTLKLTKRLYPKDEQEEVFIDGVKQKKLGYSLDALCKRLEIDNTGRTLHGALLDSEILADCYIKLYELHPREDLELDVEQTNWVRGPVKRFANLVFAEVTLTSSEEESHTQLIKRMSEKEKVAPLFLKASVLKM